MEASGSGALHTTPKSVEDKRPVRYVDPRAWTYRAERVRRFDASDRYALSVTVTADVQRDVPIFELLADFQAFWHNADPRTGRDFAACLWWEYLTDQDMDELRFTLEPTDYIRALVVPYGRVQDSLSWKDAR